MLSCFWNPKLNQPSNRGGLSDHDFYAIKQTLKFNPFLGVCFPGEERARILPFRPIISRELPLVLVDFILVRPSARARKFMPFITNIH